MLRTIIKEEKKTTAHNKYDFFKVRVWVTKQNFFIYSRFVTQRVLAVTGIKMRTCLKIAQSVKVFFVDNGKEDVTQDELYEKLFQLVKESGYGKKRIKRFKMMLSLYYQRIPIMVLLFGCGCVGKSMISQMLADRINVSSIMSTDIIFELLNMVEPEEKKKCWKQKFDSPEELVEEYKLQCLKVRDGLVGDIKKCFQKGKSIIIEGTHLDPCLFEEIVKKHIVDSSEGKVGKNKGIIFPIYLHAGENHDYFLEKTFKTMDTTLSFEELKKNYEAIEEYQLGQLENLDYEIQNIQVDLLHVKNSLDILQKVFVRKIEKLSTLFYKPEEEKK